VVNPLRPRAWRPPAAVLAILAGALALRLWGLTDRSLWLDEAVEYWVAKSPLTALAATVRDALQDPPFYSFLLHVWAGVSDHEAWLRILSVGFGMGSVAGAMVIGYRLQGRATALAAGFLMAILPVAIRYSQEAGQYAPVQCALVWSLVALVEVVRRPDRGGFARWVAVAVVAAYTYYGAVIPLLVPFLCVLIEAAIRRDAVRVRRGVLSLAIFLAAVIPLLVGFLPQQLHRGATRDALQAVTLPAPADALRDMIQALPVTIGFQFTGWPCTPVNGWLTVTVFAVLLVFAWVRQRRLAVWFGATWLVYLGLDALHVFPLGFRHSNILTALVVPVAACAVGGEHRRIHRAGSAAAFALMCTLCVLSLPNRAFYDRVHGGSACAWPETEDMAEVTRYWMERRTPEQKTYVYYGAVPAFAYYTDRMGLEHTARPSGWFVRCWRAEDAPWCRSGNVYYGEWTRGRTPEEMVASVLRSLDGRPDEFWLILGHANKNDVRAIDTHLLTHYAAVDHRVAMDASAVLLRRRAP
jgi:hypothetical protein